MDEKKILRRLRKLERRIKELEEHKVSPGRNKLEEIANFITGMFRKEDELAVREIMEKAKELGYSTQMVSRARRELLGDVIVVSTRRGQGWTWMKINT